MKSVDDVNQKLAARNLFFRVIRKISENVVIVFDFGPENFSLNFTILGYSHSSVNLPNREKILFPSQNLSAEFRG